MAERKTAKKSTKTTTRRTSASGRFTAEERAAMKERAKELKAAQNREQGEKAVLEKIAEMPPSDRTMAERIHAIVTKTAPDLMPRTWYGMPAYTREEKVVCFYKSADKFKSRYATFGFDEAANLDEGTMWVTSFALTKLTPADEKKITALVKKAAS